MAKKSTAVAKGNGDQLPADLFAEMEADAGDGLQNVTSDDMAVPFLRVLQKMSPQCSKRDGGYVAGAEEGMIFNTVTGELWDAETGVTAIPCAWAFKTVEWKPRDSGGGFVHSYGRNDVLPDSTENDKGQEVTADGNLLVPTYEFYVLLEDENGVGGQAVMTLSSTQLKYARRWISLMKNQMMQTKEGPKTLPIYGQKYLLKTLGESNEHGDWSSWDIALKERVIDTPTYHAGKAFSLAIDEGKKEVKYVVEDEAIAEVM